MTTSGRITILGMGQNRADASLAAHPAVAGADVLIASAAVLAALSASPALKIAVKAPVSAVLDEAEALLAAGKKITVLTSGDPLFYSIGVSFAERFGPERLAVSPGISSLQAAAAKFGLPWAGAAVVSVHGRQGFLSLAHAVMRQSSTCLLTDAVNTPGAAARFLLERGITNYSVRVAADMGGDKEVFWQGTLAEAAETEFPAPNVAFFLPDASLPAPSPLCTGQPESAYAREGALITKWPVRAAALAALRIEPHHTVWDLGSGSGSVAVEAASLARQGRVVSVEREARRVCHIEENRRRFGAANLDIVHAAIPACLEKAYAVTDGPDLTGSPLPPPDRIFIGGGLGGDPEDAKKALRLAWEWLPAGGRLAVTCVLLDDFALARKEILTLAPDAETTLIQAAAAAPLGNDAHLLAMNPVLCVSASKPL